MIIKIIKWVIETIFWQLIFNQISKTYFGVLIGWFTTQLLAMTYMEIIRVLRDLISNRITNNNFIRILEATFGLQIRLLFDSIYKKFFWLGFVSTLLIYKQYLLFKKILLWPFKLGIFSFIFSIFGVDPSWFLGWFNIFSLNIPQWVYIQYLTLYSNWINWWKNTAEIKNLKTESLPHIPKNNMDLIEGSGQPTGENKILNKKNILIGLTVVTLIGIGIWDFFYYSGNGAGNGGTVNPNLPLNPPQGNQPIVITDNQTMGLPGVIDYDNLNEHQRNFLLDHLENRRNAGRMSMENYEYHRNRLLPPLPVYEGPTVDQTIPPITEAGQPDHTTVSQPESTPSSAVQSNTSGLENNPEFNQYFADPNAASTPFNPVTNDNSTASGSGRRSSNIITEVDPINPSSADIPNENPNIVVTPATPTEGPDSPSGLIGSNEASISNASDSVERPASPVGSTDSSETITPYRYGGQNEPSRYAIPRRPFDPVYRGNKD